MNVTDLHLIQQIHDHYWNFAILNFESSGVFFLLGDLAEREMIYYLSNFGV